MSHTQTKSGETRATYPSALRLADAFQRFGDQRLPAMTQARLMSGRGQWLCLDPRLTWYPSGDPDIGEAVAGLARREGHALTPNGAGIGIVVHDLTATERGLIQGYLRVIPGERRTERIRAMAALGEGILDRARRAVRDGQAAGVFPELIALRRLSAKAQESEGPPPVGVTAAIAELLVRPCQDALATIGREAGIAASRVLSHVAAAYCSTVAADDGLAFAILSAEAEVIEHVIDYAEPM